MCLRRATLYLQRKAVILMGDRVRLGMMEVDERVVMCNVAAVRRFCTHGNNEVLLQ
jgi:hypothetical protein